MKLGARSELGNMMTCANVTAQLGFQHKLGCMDAALQQLYIGVFGCDSDTEESDSHTQCRANCKPGELSKGLPGLTLQKAALSALQQANMLAALCNMLGALQFSRQLAPCCRRLS